MYVLCIICMYSRTSTTIRRHLQTSFLLNVKLPLLIRLVSYLRDARIMLYYFM